MKCPACGAEIPDNARFCPKCGTRQRYIPDDPLNGARIADRYLILEWIGEGGSGKVYLARDVQQGRRVVLKILHRELLGDASAILRFRREAEAVMGLDNPHIIKIYDIGETHDRLPFIVMEYLDGETLASLLSREGALPYARARHIVAQICEGLMAAHSAGLIHRDLRPRNIMLTRLEDHDDFVKILDFGLAKILPQGGDPSRSFIGFVMGDATYTAPELLVGKGVSPATDIYSLAVMFYEMLSGTPPFTGNTVMDIMSAHIRNPYPALEGRVPGLPRGIDRVLARALAKKPEDRYDTAYQFLEDVMALGEGKEEARPEPQIQKAARPSTKSTYYNLSAVGRGEEGPAYRVPGGGIVRLPVEHPSPNKFVYLERPPVEELYEAIQEVWEKERGAREIVELEEELQKIRKRERAVWLVAGVGIVVILLMAAVVGKLVLGGSGDIIVMDSGDGAAPQGTGTDASPLGSPQASVPSQATSQAEATATADGSEDLEPEEDATGEADGSSHPPRRRPASVRRPPMHHEDLAPMTEQGADFEDLIQKGRSKFDSGEFLAAEIYYKKALALRPHSIKALLGLEAVYFETGQHSKAVRLLAREAPRHRSATLWYRLGINRMKLGDIEGAKKAFTKALEIRPGYQAAIRALKSLGSQ